MSTVRFLRQFLARPGTIGAVAPSSAALARAMIAALDLHGARNIVEYGPGTGVFTELISREMPPTARVLAIEISPALASIFRARHPSIPLVEDTVANVRQVCDRFGIDSVDRILSGLPWAAFSEATQRQLLDATMSVLEPGGRFVTFAYVHGLPLPGGRRLASLLPEYFRTVERSAVVWRNLPMAVVYRCVR